MAASIKKITITIGCLGGGCAALYALVFAYYHPHIPITLPSATACTLYGIEYKRQFIDDQMMGGVTKPVLPPLFDRNFVITKGPFVCKPSVMMTAETLIASPLSYQRADGSEPGVRFDPFYAYRLTGPTGSVIVFVGEGVDISRFDRHGKLVADSGVTGGNAGQWTELLRESLPHDEVIKQWWTEYNEGRQEETTWQRLGDRIGIPLGQ